MSRLRRAALPRAGATAMVAALALAGIGAGTASADTNETEPWERAAIAAPIKLDPSFENLQGTDCMFLDTVIDWTGKNHFPQVQALAQEARHGGDQDCIDFILDPDTVTTLAGLDSKAWTELKAQLEQEKQDRIKVLVALEIESTDQLVDPEGAVRDFVYNVWKLTDPDKTEVRTAALTAYGKDAAAQHTFVTEGVFAALKTWQDRKIAEDTAATEAERQHQLARNLKRHVALTLGMTVTDELLDLPDDAFLRELLKKAEQSSNVYQDADAALRSNDPADWTAYIATGFDAAVHKDEIARQQREIAAIRTQVMAIQTGANEIGDVDLARAATKALASDDDALRQFFLHGQYELKYQSQLQGGVLGNYDFKDTYDRAVAFDYDHSGKDDAVLTYRAGKGAAWVQTHGPGNGFGWGSVLNGKFGNVKLDDPKDRIIAFDYDHTGKNDALVAYAPGRNYVSILRHDGTTDTWTKVYDQKYLAGFDFADPNDRLIAYDFDHSGKKDYLVAYRSGRNPNGTIKGVVWIIKHEASGAFTRIYYSDALTNHPGIGGYDLAATQDTMFTIDLDGSGNEDYLALYRPSTTAPTFWIVKHIGTGTAFSDFKGVVYGDNIAGFKLNTSIRDAAMAFDYDHDGRNDDVLAYKPGAKQAVIFRHTGGTGFEQVYTGTGAQFGLELSNPLDQLIAFDYDHSGKNDAVLAWRPDLTAHAVGIATRPKHV